MKWYRFLTEAENHPMDLAMWSLWVLLKRVVWWDRVGAQPFGVDLSECKEGELYFSSILHIHYYNFTHKSPLHWTPCNSGLILETIWSFVSVSFLRNELPFHIFLIYLIYLKLWTSDFSALSYLWCLLNYFWFKQVWSFNFPFFSCLGRCVCWSRSTFTY